MSIARKVMEEPGRYSIQQLQQAMERGILPAYIAVPLIQEKTQLQKQFQQQQMMQQPSPKEMPPIAAQIMQEAQGVEQLSTNLPEEYAAGGIVAFDEGGEVEPYAAGGVIALAGGGNLRAKAMFDDLMREQQFQEQLDRIKKARDAAKAAAEAAKTAGPAAAAAAEAATAAEAVTGAANAASGPSRFQAIRQALQPSGMLNPNIPLPSGSGVSGVLKGGARLAGKLAGPLAVADLATTGYDVYKAPTDVIREYYGQQLAPGEEPSFWGDVGIRSRAALGMLNPFGSTQEGIAALMAKKRAEEAAATPAPEKEQAKPTAREVADAGQGAAGPGAGGPGAGGASIRGIFDQLRQAQESYPGQKSMREEVEPLLKTYMEKADKAEAARKEEAARLRGQVTGKAYEGLEADLRKEAEEMGADKEQAKYMAIFKAGLAMMAGTSRHALENIGKGAMVGAEDYQKAAADIKKAQKENRLMMAHIENARRAEQRGDIEKQVDELDKATTRQETRDQFYATSLASAGIKDQELRRQLAQNLTTVTGSIYGHQLSADAQRALVAARLQGRGELTQAQLARITGDVIKEIGDRKLFDLAAAKKLGGKDAKPPDSGPIRDKIDAMYRQEINKRIRERMQFIPGYEMEEADPNAGYERVTG